MKSLPNILTISRIMVIPIVVSLIYFRDQNFYFQIAAAILFSLACITDFLDGYLARYLKAQTFLGKFLDPIADKLLVGSLILVLVHQGRADLLPSLAIMCREMMVSGLREVLAEIKMYLPSSKIAKVKTAFQMLAILLILLTSKETEFLHFDILGKYCLWLAAILTLYTGYQYLKAGIKYIDLKSL